MRIITNLWLLWARGYRHLVGDRVLVGRGIAHRLVSANRQGAVLVDYLTGENRKEVSDLRLLTPDPVKYPKGCLEAWQLAHQGHGGQMYGEAPYILHLQDVVYLINGFQLAIRPGGVDSLGYMERRWHRHDLQILVMTSILHDYVEDVDGAWDGAGFSPVVVQGVRDLSGDPPQYDRLRRNETALTVKLADRLANTTRCLAGRAVSFAGLDKESPAEDLLRRIALVSVGAAAASGAHEKYLAGYQRSYPEFRRELWVRGQLEPFWAALDAVSGFES